MNWQHTRITLSPISGSVLLTASAGAEVRPIEGMKGVNETRYEKDLPNARVMQKKPLEWAVRLPRLRVPA